MNSLPTWAVFVILAGLILASGFFSASETSLMRLGRYRLRHLSRTGHRGARIAEYLLKRPDRILGVILLGNNFLNIAASVVATVLALRFGGGDAVGIATGILTFTILIFAELAPKTLAALRPEPTAFAVSYVLIVLQKLLYPIVWVLNTISNGLLWLLGLRMNHLEAAGITSEEFRTLVLESGSLRLRRQQMLLGVLELEEATVEDIMVPRSRIEGVDIAEPPAQVLAQLRASRYSHLPLYREGIEHLVGILHLPDLLPHLTADDFDAETLVALAREAHFVPESTSLARVLLNFQSERADCALVVDEYGDILGLLTLEDMLSVIAGGITSVGDENLGEIVRQADGAFLVPGHMSIRALNRSLGWHLPTDGPRTVNGLVLEQLQTLPHEGTRLTLGNHRGEIVATDRSGVASIRFEAPSPPDEVHE
ncbi:MAG: HlyC/CorC family transporter [Gammaproteobacteria bacterium]